MTIPFRRDQSDADRLNDLLDAMRSGTRPPDSSADEADDLARTARQFRGLSDRAASVDPAPATTFDAIWEDMMSAHSIAPPLPADTGSATPITPETHRVPTVPGMPHQSRWQSLLSAAIVVIVLAGLVATAWNLRGTGEGGTTDPGENARLAATAMQDSTPEASPAAPSDDWTAWVTPQECSVEPMSRAEYASILSEAPDVSSRSYTLVGPADPESAQNAVEAARTNRACIEYGMENERRGTESDASIFYRNPNANQPMSAVEYSEQQASRGKEISAQMESLTEEDFYLITTTEPPEELLAKWSSNSSDPSPVVGSVSYNPDKAFALEDGRIVIPDTSLWWYADPAMAEAPPDDGYVSGTVVILQDKGEVWKVDESLRVCMGECDTFWDGIPGASGLTSATPVATLDTESTDDWTAWVTPQECSVEPMSDEALASILSSPDDPERSYTVAGPADPGSAQAATDSARTWRACVEYRMDDHRRGVETDAFIRTWEANISEPQPGYREQQADRGRELSPRLDMLDAANFSVATTVDPPQDLLDKWEGNTTGPVPIVNSLAYNPDAALALEDGRILIPETTLRWDAEPASSGMSHVTTSLQPVTGQVLILANEDGMWKVDELLYVCLGECDDFWAGFEETTETPIATPEG